MPWITQLVGDVLGSPRRLLQRMIEDCHIDVGTYELGLRGEGDVTDPAAWRIHRFGFDLKFIEGNPDLEAHADEETPREV